MAQEIKGIHTESWLSNDGKIEALSSVTREDQAFVPAKELTYSLPLTDWKFTADGTAEFQGTKPQVTGKYDVKNLKKGRKYEVYIWVTTNNRVIENVVNFKLELPDKDCQIRNATVTIYPNRWIAVPMGEFKNTFDDGDITFTFTGKHGADSWTGLLIKGVMIAKSDT